MTDNADIAAIKDILECMRKPKREMQAGHELAPKLLGVHLNTTEHQKSQLISALGGVIEQQLQELRARNLGSEQAAIYTTLSVKQRLEQDMRSNAPHLQALSIAWAYYAENMSKREIGGVYSLTVRAIEYRLNSVYAYIATLPMTPRSSINVGGEQPTPSGHQFVQENNALQPNVRQYQYAGTIINGDNVMVDQRTITHNTRTTTYTTTKQQGSDDVDIQNTLPLIVAGALLLVLMRWPVVATLMLLAVILWRTTANGWLAYNNWNTALFNEKTRENTWYVMYVLPWVGLCVFALYTATTLPTILRYPPFEMPRIIFAFHLFLIGAGVLVLGMVDTMFFLHHLDDEHWIAKLLPGWKERARSLWERRWQTVYICVAFIGVCLVGALVIANLWSLPGTSFTP